MAAPHDVVSIREKFGTFDELWSPKIVAEANGWHLLIVKAQGEFTWHHHVDLDEVFMVVSGQLKIAMPDRDVCLDAGDIFVIPRGVEHRPDAGDGCELILLEPAGEPNTGNVGAHELTAVEEWI